MLTVLEKTIFTYVYGDERAATTAQLEALLSAISQLNNAEVGSSHASGNYSLRNEDGELALNIAIRTGKREMTRALLASGLVSVSASNSEGNTCLHTAAESSHEHAQAILLTY